MESSDDLTNELPESDDLRSRVERLERIADERSKETAPLRSVLEEIRLELRESQAEYRQGIAELRQDVTKIHQDVTEIRQDMTELRQDMTELRQDVTEIHQDLASFRTEMRGYIADSTRNITQIIQSGFTQVNFDMALMSTRVSDLEARVTKIEESRAQ